MNEELIDEIVGQSVDVYKVAPEHTNQNIYGESTTKYFNVGFSTLYLLVILKLFISRVAQ